MQILFQLFAFNISDVGIRPTRIMQNMLFKARVVPTSATLWVPETKGVRTEKETPPPFRDDITVKDKLYHYLGLGSPRKTAKGP